MARENSRTWRNPLAFLLIFLAALFAASCTEAVTPTLDVTPAGSTLGPGETVQLFATLTYPNAAEDATNLLDWGSSDITVATVGNAVHDDGSATKGLVKAVGVGSATIQAVDPKSGSVHWVTISVTAPVLRAIQVSPFPSVVVPKGTTRQFRALAIYSNATTKDVTESVAWASSNTSALLIGDLSGTKGLATGIAAGNTNVTATEGVTGIQGFAVAFVTAPPTPPTATLRSLTVTPNPALLAVGATVQLTAMGTYSDGSQGDLSGVVVWSTSSGDVATIGPSGLVSAVGIGQATLSASDPNGAVRGSAALTVTP